MSAEPQNTIKVCPRCKATFPCCAGGCWCSELPAVMPMVSGAECYCPQCLREAIAEKVNIPVPAN